MRGQFFWKTMLLLTLKRQDFFVNIFLVVEKLINIVWTPKPEPELEPETKFFQSRNHKAAINHCGCHNQHWTSHLINLQGAEDGGGEGGAVQQAGHEALVLRLRQVLILAQDLRQLLVSHSFCCSSEIVKKINSSSGVSGGVQLV